MCRLTFRGVFGVHICGRPWEGEEEAAAETVHQGRFLGLAPRVHVVSARVGMKWGTRSTDFYFGVYPALLFLFEDLFVPQTRLLKSSLNLERPASLRLRPTRGRTRVRRVGRM